MRLIFTLFALLFLPIPSPGQSVSDALSHYLSQVPPTVRVSLAFNSLTADSTAFYHRADVLTPAASLIKLPILVAVMAQAAEGRFELDEIHILTDSEKVGGSGTIRDLPHRSRITYRDLLRQMMIQSDNTATNIFINEIGMDAVNARMRTLGLTQSRLARVMMDTAAARRGRENLVTAREMNALLTKIYRNEALPELAGRSNGTADSPARCADMLTMLKANEDRLTIPAGLPAGTIIAHKTGELPYVRADAGIVYRPDRPFVLSILVEGTTTPNAERVIADIARLCFEK